VKTFWRWTGTIFFALAFIFLSITGLGTALPIEHHATCSASYVAPVKYLFGEVQDDAASTRWRPGIRNAVLVSSRYPTAEWRETDIHGGVISYRETADPRRNTLSREIDFVPGMPFSGTWTFKFTFTPGKTVSGRDRPLRDFSAQELEIADALYRLSRGLYGPDGITRVTIVEDGKIYNPFFRFMAHYVFGYTQTMQSYLRDLGAHVRQNPEVACGANA
jgi:hypothetical protein